ncbi:KilA-N domain-containing protein [Kiloniella laminariae]|uniref:KilA-N domain-containing protein n=1 Tax=Kiloniella laminariae TaxID=454162 RepID=UPI000381CA42|nr:KilA-N domain-containing protein [Kiloniella laminariae]
MTGLIQHTISNSVINQRIEDGYISATLMCCAAGKLFSDYRRLSSTREYLSALKSDMGNPTTGLIQSRRGGVPSEQGTWVHPKVAIHLAQWLSPKFAVQVTSWVYDWMSGARVMSAPEPVKEIPQSGRMDDLTALLRMSLVIGEVIDSPPEGVAGALKLVSCLRKDPELTRRLDIHPRGKGQDQGLPSMALLWAMDQPVPSGERAVLTALARRADRRGNCSMTQEQIANLSGVTDRSVRRLLRSLEGRGLVSMSRNSGVYQYALSCCVEAVIGGVHGD